VENREKIYQVGRGFCMGCADVIPGVSGGTLALILGIYEQLIESIKLMDATLVRAVLTGPFWRKLFGGIFGRFTSNGDEVDRRVEAVLFVGFLIIGIGSAIVAAAGLITYCRMHYPGQTLGLFLGLVAASLMVPYRRMEKRGPAQWATFLLFAVGTFLLLGLGQLPETPALWYVFMSGAIAICAMILPGISGAFILLMLGMYDYIVVKQLKPLLYDRQFDGLVPILVFMVGMVTGIVAFSRLLHYLLRRWHDVTMAGLLGLMLGSLRVLWPFKEAFSDDPKVRVESLRNVLPDLSAPAFWPTIGTIAAGIIIVLVLDSIGRRRYDSAA
jgi:putative membrane protein